MREILQRSQESSARLGRHCPDMLLIFSQDSLREHSEDTFKLAGPWLQFLGHILNLCRAVSGGSLSLYLCHVFGLCKSNPRQLSLLVVLTGGILGYPGQVLAYILRVQKKSFRCELLSRRYRRNAGGKHEAHFVAHWWADNHKEALAGGAGRWQEPGGACQQE